MTDFRDFDVPAMSRSALPVSGSRSATILTRPSDASPNCTRDLLRAASTRSSRFDRTAGSLTALRQRRRRAVQAVDEGKVDGSLPIDARNAARKAKNFKESDRIRDELKAMGVVLKDKKDGTTWEVKR